FINAITFEMRHPLSAIMQCADDILECYPKADNHFSMPSADRYAAILNQTLYAAQIIAQCAQHMRQIVDDMLTIPKIESGPFFITPIDAQPESVVSHAVKIFESKAKAADVNMTLHVDQSFRNLNINWMSLDPIRLGQVLINLINNALKATRLGLESPRSIKVILSASKEEPCSAPGNIQFGTKLTKEDPRLIEDWKLGSTLYLQFSVADSGRGLSEHERSTLFGRYDQASPRTHIKYDDSGLGLLISRRLTELQGGAIGLCSEPEKGSTFSFYIKTRRSEVDSRRTSLLEVFPEDMRARPSIGRLQSALNSGVPAAAIGLPGKPSLRELKLKNAIADGLHVLVVDDNQINQKILTKLLQKIDCIVNVANHGGEALDFLKKTKHWSAGKQTPPNSAETQHLSANLNVIFMDWEMPIMNGREATVKIRQLETSGTLLDRIPVIGLMANVQQQQIQMAMDAGMDDVISKPILMAEVMEKLRGVV
ncbi:hypothetical protein DM02DRAFT_517556, partial [Periconia macrospinosa]